LRGGLKHVFNRFFHKRKRLLDKADRQKGKDVVDKGDLVQRKEGIALVHPPGINSCKGKKILVRQK
jgi:hypothetical protein